eukprot:6486828-Amphidinium_carterae.2
MPTMNLTPWLCPNVSRSTATSRTSPDQNEPKAAAKKEQIEGVKEDTTEEPKYIHGKAALTLKFEHWLKLANNPSLKELQVFLVWQHLRTEEQATQVAKWRDSLLKGSPTPAMPAKTSGTEKQAKKKQQSDADHQASCSSGLPQEGGQDSAARAQHTSSELSITEKRHTAHPIHTCTHIHT